MKILSVDFGNDIWAPHQIKAYNEFKKILEFEGLIENISEEFNEEEDILVISKNNQEDIFESINEIAVSMELDWAIEFNTNYEYDIKRAIREFGTPEIYAFGGQVVFNPQEYEDKETSFYGFLEDCKICLYDVAVAGIFGKKMIWSLPNGLGLADVRWVD